ncbi:TPA: hypothetical protein ACJHGT_004353 [Yersinia enterocolitica]
MKLPEHRYYTLEKAAKTVGCDVSDLIHFAAIGVLQICIKMPMIDFFFNLKDKGEEDADPELLKVESTSILLINEVELQQEKTNKDKIPDIHWLRFSYKSDYFSITERYEVNKREKDIEKWSGMLAIPQEFIEHEEQELSLWDDWDISICELYPPRCDMVSHDPKYLIGVFYIDGWYEINRRDMYITSYELGLLSTGGKNINAEGNTSEKLKSEPANVVNLQVNKRSERHAANRENLLKSAIYILSHYPEECRGERKEISPEKWRDCLLKRKNEVPPLMITNEEVILKHLRTAVNGKG